MYKFLLLIFIIVSSILSAQNSFCLFEPENTTVRNPSLECTFSVCEDSTVLYQYHPASQIESKLIRLRWLLFSDDNGEYAFDKGLVEDYIPILNSIFSDYHFQFEVFEILEFKNTEINHADRDEWEYRVDFYSPYVKHQDEMINILVTKEFGNWDNRAFATFPFDIPQFDYYTFLERHGVIVINQSLLLPGSESFHQSLPHELGHIFGLMHPNFKNADCNSLGTVISHTFIVTIIPNAIYSVTLIGF